MFDISSNLCPGGYKCSAGRSAIPTAGDADECAAQLFCPTGTAHGYECEDGKFIAAGVKASAACGDCGQGKYCYLSGATGSFTRNQVTCNTGSTCDLSTQTRQPKCSGGAYLDGSNACVRCEDGNYCRGGRSAGKCEAGFLCLKSDTSTLYTSPTPTNKEVEIHHFLPEGTVTKVECPTGKVRLVKGSRNPNDCIPCEPGLYCPNIQNTIACPEGQWCAEKGALAAQPAPADCPIYTYSVTEKLFKAEQCKVCPAGYFCNTTKITTYALYECPIGYYCLTNSYGAESKKKCPPGTYRNVTKGTNLADCFKCPFGYYCSGVDSVTPTRCTAGNECVQGSEIQVTCQAGYYCNTTTNF